MLCRLDIRDFAIVDRLSVEFAPGFSSITGETGAGKSIMLDALGLVLGDRAAADMVRPGSEGADLAAEFDITAIEEARAWLAEHDLVDPDAPERCLLRRTLGADGRSRAFVNGRPVTLQDVRSLADHLIDIHSQHAHQSLLRRDVQRRLLDEFGGHAAKAADVARAHGAWQRLAEEHDRLQGEARERADRRQLLGYQVEELDAVAPSRDELATLEAEQRRLAGAEAAIERVAGARAAIEDDDDTLLDRVRRVIALLEQVDDRHPALDGAREMLVTARVNLEEAGTELRRYGDLLEPDPERLSTVDDRLGTLHDLARKHRVAPDDLPALHARLQAELEEIDGGGARLEALAQERDAARARLLDAAAGLSAARVKAARKLEKAVTEQLRSLGMKEARFLAALTPLDADRCGPGGLEQVDFQVTANKGMAPGPLGRIASGGELSRISLAIQVITAATSHTPSLVLDEADVGIGGRTAEVVGRMLRRLGAHTQVLAVTHLPQVAALGHQHLAVVKNSARGKGATRTEIVTLDEDARVAELARMLGGMEITAQTRAHAGEMRARAVDPA
ncbi:MAG: DNA repair protein RecN [Pseudomonadales bacterium]|jgi:DNA repair protein RecN (Recombination protein N)|nr:DNA repair protein RecN [Pseudomonadales bacterium]